MKDLLHFADFIVVHAGSISGINAPGAWIVSRQAGANYAPAAREKITGHVRSVLILRMLMSAGGSIISYQRFLPLFSGQTERLALSRYGIRGSRGIQRS